ATLKGEPVCAGKSTLLDSRGVLSVNLSPNSYSPVSSLSTLPSIRHNVALSTAIIPTEPRTFLPRSPVTHLAMAPNNKPPPVCVPDLGPHPRPQEEEEKGSSACAAISIGLMLSCSISTWGYPAISLTRMSLPDSPVKFTPGQESWFATVQLLMYIPGSLLGGVLCESLGPRKVLLLLAPLLWASYVLMSLASWELLLRTVAPEHFLLGCRAVQGFSGALINPVTYIYTYEATGKRHRGSLIGFLDWWATLGMFLCYVSGYFLSWETVALLVPSVTAIPAFIGLLFTPESPMWMARKGKEKAAREALTKLRNAAEVSEELEAVTNVPVAKTTFKNSLREVLQKPNLLAMFAAVLVIFLKEINGNAVVAIYIVHIFQYAGVGLDPNLSSVMVGAVRLACNCIAVVLMHNVRRKPMLSVGTILTALSGASIATFFFLQTSDYDVSLLGWLPLTALTAFTIGYAAAVGPLCWVISVEVLPGSVRSIGCGTTNAFQSTSAFLISMSFPTLQAAIGLHGVFWSYASCTLLCIIMVVIFVPETQGKTLKDIEDYWGNMCKKSKKEPPV
ncbi:facilitated trehalose transporter Tret1-like, partial [Penaeus japonicus]|uniref:facilitated trehalose transporter Tret1-like n=1 Tax=Penaeus japonicus TaxID=27405 RepID=UPI001C70E747